MTGQIKKLVEDRLFGFILTADGSQLFFHKSDLHYGVQFNQLKEGMVVSFNMLQTAKGARATNVSLDGVQ